MKSPCGKHYLIFIITVKILINTFCDWTSNTYTCTNTLVHVFLFFFYFSVQFQSQNKKAVNNFSKNPYYQWEKCFVQTCKFLINWRRMQDCWYKSRKPKEIWNHHCIFYVYKIKKFKNQNFGQLHHFCHQSSCIILQTANHEISRFPKQG